MKNKPRIRYSNILFLQEHLKRLELLIAPGLYRSNQTAVLLIISRHAYAELKGNEVS